MDLSKLSLNMKIILVVAIAGVAVAALLTSFHYSEASEGRFCSTAAGCGTVNTSEYSTIGPVPVSILGLLGYLGVLIAVFVSLKGGDLARLAVPAVFGLSLIGVLYSAYLTYLELYVIHAICPWCVLSAILMAVIFVLSMAELRRTNAAAA